MRRTFLLRFFFRILIVFPFSPVCLNVSKYTLFMVSLKDFSRAVLAILERIQKNSPRPSQYQIGGYCTEHGNECKEYKHMEIKFVCYKNVDKT